MTQNKDILSDNLQNYGENYGAPQRTLGDLEPRLCAVEKCLDNVVMRQERIVAWITDLDKEIKELKTSVNAFIVKY